MGVCFVGGIRFVGNVRRNVYLFELRVVRSLLERFRGIQLS